VRLFSVDGRELDEVIAVADRLRHESVGDTVTYVINRNINYTNICLYHCGFCAFSKGRGCKDLRGPAYTLELDEVARRTVEAAAAGATEVCLQGGIHPTFTGETYLNIVRAVKGAVPWMHVHAFSPLEVQHGANRLGLSVAIYLERLRDAGLSTLPGTAAEILDDEIRAVICPDKLRTDEWLNVIGTAHEVGLRTTATIMFGHVEQPVHWARHLSRLRALQARTGGISEFVPLGFVHMEAPLWRKGRTRSGPSFREAVLMHTVPRLVLHPLIKNIQTSWVKMGANGAALCLDAGANDLGGTLMNEAITRAAGGAHGQELDAATLRALAETHRPPRTSADHTLRRSWRGAHVMGGAHTLSLVRRAHAARGAAAYCRGITSLQLGPSAHASCTKMKLCLARARRICRTNPSGDRLGFGGLSRRVAISSRQAVTAKTRRDVEIERPEVTELPIVHAGERSSTPGLR
jgi:FO synthase